MTVPAVLDVPTEAPMTPAAERILDAAGTLFYTRGIRAVGVDSIAEAAGTTKKTIYDRFGSKDGLIVAYLHRRSLRWRSLVLDFIRPLPVGRAQALAVFDATDEWMASWVRGAASSMRMPNSAEPTIPVSRSSSRRRRGCVTCSRTHVPQPATPSPISSPGS